MQDKPSKDKFSSLLDQIYYKALLLMVMEAFIKDPLAVMEAWEQVERNAEAKKANEYLKNNPLEVIIA